MNDLIVNMGPQNVHKLFDEMPIRQNSASVGLGTSPGRTPWQVMLGLSL